MKSIAQQHFERVSAAQAAAGNPLASVHPHGLMHAKLATDRQRLKAIQSIERKIAVKRALLPDYEAYVTGALESGRGAQDEVLMTVMVWRIDVGDFAGALAIAAYALRYGLTLPDPYQRTVATFVTEEIAEAALSALAAGQTVSTEILIPLAELTGEHDMPDPVRAKLHKALGGVLQATQPQIALTHWRRALALHERCGVKKDLDRLERTLATTTVASQDQDSPPPSGEDG